MVKIFDNINLTSSEKRQLENRIKSKIIYANVPELQSIYYDEEELAIYEENLINSLWSKEL